MSEMRRCIPTLLAACLAVGPTAAEAQETQQMDPLTGQPVRAESAPDPAEEAPPRADLSEANGLVRAGDYVRAEIVLAEQQEKFPDDPRLQLLHGEVLLALSQPARALPILERAAELDGDRPRVHFQLATALQATGARDRALEAYVREIELNDDTQVKLMARKNRVVLLQQSGRWAEAAAELGALLELDPAQVAAYGDMTSSYLEAGMLAEAGQSLERGLEQGFRSAPHFYSLGKRHAEKRAWKEAIGAYRRALEIDPSLADVERGLAAALDQSGKSEEALPHLHRYLELRPDAPDAARVSQRIQELEGS